MLVRYPRAQSLLKLGYVKTERHDKLRPNAFPCFSLYLRQTAPRDTYEVLLSSGSSVVHSRNVPWTRLPPSVPIYAESVRSVSVSREGGKLDPSRHKVAEEDEDAVNDESSESTGVRSRVIARLIASTPAAVPCGRAAPTGGRGIAATTSLKGAHKRDFGYIRA